MSSAALQSAPHHTATSVASLNSPPLVAASPASSRHHQQQQSTSSPGRDAYHATSQNSTSSSASKRPSRKHSGGKGDAPSQSNSPMSSRAALASPVPVNVASSDQYRASSSDRRKDMPTAVPPRTSSQQNAGGSGGGPSSKRSTTQHGAERSIPQRHAIGDANGQASGNQGYQDEAASRDARSRRSGYAGKEQPQRSARDSRDASSTSMPIRTASSSHGPSREASEILNSMVVSPPEDDVERERERAAFAQAHTTGTLDDHASATAPSSEQPHVDETRRGGRSRHDFSKREKHTKFGEYILGNTIGEGEFGKVKLGWKQ